MIYFICMGVLLLLWMLYALFKVSKIAEENSEDPNKNEEQQK